MDFWITGLLGLSSRRIKMQEFRKNLEMGILDFFDSTFCAYLLDLQQSINPTIQSSMGR